MSPDAYTDRFWEALADGRFLVGDCGGCGRAHFPPSPVCPHCGADAGWAESGGVGSLYSFSRQHRTAPGFDEPLVVGLVELDEGARLLARVDADYGELSVGDRVAVEPCEYDGGMDRGRLADEPFFRAVPR